MFDCNFCVKEPVVNGQKQTTVTELRMAKNEIRIRLKHSTIRVFVNSPRQLNYDHIWVRSVHIIF